MRQKPILITGNAGFIGSALTKRLSEKGKIIGIDIKQARVENKNTVNIMADITDKKETAAVFERHEIDAIVHLAAKSGVRASFKNPAEYRLNNIKGTESILR